MNRKNVLAALAGLLFGTGLAFADTNLASVLVPGEKVEFTTAIKQDSLETLSYMGITKLKKANIGLWVPSDFNPSDPWKILLISATDKASSVQRMNGYLEAAKKAGGWIVMAADGTIRPDGTDNGVFECDSYRYAVMRAGLRALEAQWPAARQWPVAVAGSSGGAKRSGYMSTILMMDGYSLIGMWMGGCNENTPGVARLFNDPGERYLEVPIFLSAGVQDTIATVADVTEVRDSLKACGFKNVRMKTHSGGHVVYSPHVLEGLRWFTEQMGAMPTYKVAFNANGGKGKMARQTMTYGKSAKLRKNAFARSGCVFRGWAKTKTGKVVYKNGASVKNLRKDGRTTTLYAKWAKKTYKVAFNANGGKGKMAKLTLIYGKSVKLRKNTFVRPGYTFAGWAKTKKGAVAYKDRAQVKNLRVDGKTTTLYAKWTKVRPVPKSAKRDMKKADKSFWAPVTASGGENADAVADRDMETAWTADAANGAWVVLAFPEALDVGDVEVAGENLPEGIRFLLSEDAEEWREEVPGRARYVWVAFPASDNPLAVKEIRVVPE